MMQPPARPGMLGPGRHDTRTVSFAEETYFGMAVKKNSSGLYLPPSATTTTISGVVMANDNFMEKVKAKGVGIIVAEGLIWVLCEENISEGDDVYVRFKDFGSYKKGGFRSDADTRTISTVSTAHASQLTGYTYASDAFPFLGNYVASIRVKG